MRTVAKPDGHLHGHANANFSVFIYRPYKE